MVQDKKMILCAGGSGGHLIPLLVISERLQQEGIEPVLVTDKRGLHIKKNLTHIRYFVIQAEGIINRKLYAKVRASFKLLIGFFQSLRILIRERPQAVMGFGAHTSLPICFAAYVLKIPVFIHEQNAILGRANRFFSPYASKVLTSFTATYGVPINARDKVICCGNPVREQVIKAREIAYHTPTVNGERHILIFGGSQGANIMDEMILQSIALLPKDLQSQLVITHQARQESAEAVKKKYDDMGVKSEVASFFVDLPERLTKTHLVLCRAGATTIAEITAIGRPAVLLPFRYAVDQHQLLNAMRLTENNSAWMVEEESFDKKAFARRLLQLLTNPELLSETAVRARNSGFPEATARMLEILKSAIEAEKEGEPHA